jgi:hypothetical protein
MTNTEQEYQVVETTEDYRQRALQGHLAVYGILRKGYLTYVSTHRTLKAAQAKCDNLNRMHLSRTH